MGYLKTLPLEAGGRAQIGKSTYTMGGGRSKRTYA